MFAKLIPVMATSMKDALNGTIGSSRWNNIRRAVQGNSSSEAQSDEEDQVFESDDEEEINTEVLLTANIEKTTHNLKKLQDKLENKATKHDFDQKNLTDKNKGLSDSNDNLQRQIDEINLPDIQNRSHETETVFNKLYEANNMSKVLEKERNRSENLLKDFKHKYDTSVEKKSDVGSQENTFRRQESINWSEMEKQQIAVTENHRSINLKNDEIRIFKAEFETLFPDYVFSSVLENDVDAIKDLMETGKKHSSEQSTKLTNLKKSLDEGQKKLTSSQGEFENRKRDWDTKKKEIVDLQKQLDGNKLKLASLKADHTPENQPPSSQSFPEIVTHPNADPDTNSETDMNSETEHIEKSETEHIEKSETEHIEKSETDTENRYHTEKKRLQDMLEKLEAEKSDLNIESSRSTQDKIDDTCKLVQEHKRSIDSSENNLFAHNKIIAEINLKLKEFDVFKGQLSEEQDSLHQGEFDANKTNIVSQKIKNLEQETQKCKLKLGEEENQITIIESIIHSGKVDISTACDNFKYLVDDADFSTESEFNLDAVVMHMIDLQMIERSKMDLILLQEKALNDQIAETTTKKKSVEVEFEEAKKLIHTPKNDLSLSFGATFTHKGTKNGKPQSLEHITKQKKSASSTYESTSELAPKGYQTHDESKSTVGGDTGPIRMILPPSTMPFISKDMKGESHVPPVSHTESLKSEAEHGTPSLTSKANTSSQLSRMDTTHTTAKKNSSPQVSPKASVTHLDLSKSSIDAVHTNETPQVSISKTSNKHILSDTTEELRINKEKIDRKKNETMDSEQKVAEIEHKRGVMIGKIKVHEQGYKSIAPTASEKVVTQKLKSELTKIEEELKVAEKQKDEDFADLLVLSREKTKIIDDDKRSKKSVPTPTILHSASLQAILTKLKRKPHIRDDTSYTMTQSISDVPLLVTGVDPTTIEAALTRHLLCDFHAILRDASTYDYEVDADCIAENSKSLCRVRMPNQDIMFVEIIPDEANKSNPVIQLYYQAGSKRSEIIQYRMNNIVQEWCHMLEHR